MFLAKLDKHLSQFSLLHFPEQSLVYIMIQSQEIDNSAKDFLPIL